jgi:opacity protein-like surface antigen
MKTLFPATLLLLLIPLGADAQNQAPAPVEISASYSFLREGVSDGINANGASGSLAINANGWLGLVGDFGYYHASPGGIGTNTLTYLFGPRFSYRASNQVTPFAQILAGGAHVSVPGFASTNGFAFSAGGGLDLRVSRQFALRPQFDYIGIRSGNITLNTFRASFGVVYRFGD